MADVKARLGATQRRLRAFELDRSRAEEMIGALQGGVAFVEGTYGFHDAAGAPLRYTGTAFLVSRDGTLFTNRHIAEPWLQNDAAKELVAKGHSPRLASLRATFGGSGGPILSAHGRVIGLNAAILTEFSGASFGVPIRFATALLPAPPKAPSRKPRKAPG